LRPSSGKPIRSPFKSRSFKNSLESERNVSQEKLALMSIDRQALQARDRLAHGAFDGGTRLPGCQ
jgi:hypothetical protein